MTTIDLGGVTVARITEMHGPLMPPDQFFPEMPADAWTTHRKSLAPDHLTPDGSTVSVAIQTWLLRSGGRTILIDTGIGNDKARPAVEPWDHLSTSYLTTLLEAGVSPEDVDLVVNTHLHVDHIGWNTMLVDNEWVPTFPNATYLMPKTDFEHMNPDNNASIAGSVNENAYADSVTPIYNAGQVKLWEDSFTIDENLTLEAAPGHTPGASVVRLKSGSDQALFAGDLLHTPLQLSHPDHSSCFCEDPIQARATRRRLLGWAADANALVLPAHFAGHSALEVDARGDSFSVKSWAAFPKL